MLTLKSRPWLILPVAVALFIGGALSLQSWTLGLLLEDNARGAATAWTRFISGKVSDFRLLATGVAPSAETLDFMKWIQTSSRIFRYKIYDTSGRAHYVFDRVANYSAHGTVNAEQDATALAAAKTGQTFVTEKTSTPDDDIPVMFYAQTYVPTVDADGKVSAVVAVYLDQTAKRAEFARISLIGGLALVMLVTLAFGLPAIGWYKNDREKRRAAERARYLADFDALSNLPNRTRITEELTRFLADGGAASSLTIIKVNIDGFTELTRSLGAAAGDEIIRTTAERLRHVAAGAGPQELVGRLFGDEFVVVSRAARAQDQALLLAERIGRAIAQPLTVSACRLSLSACMGIALAPADGTDAQCLLKSARMALARAKSIGRGRIEFFSPDLDSDIQARRAVEQAITTAFATGGFTVNYQPICSTASGALTGFEALARLPAANGGFIPPAVFVSAIERMGLIHQLGAWILTEACTTAAAWPEHMTLSVNLSASQVTRPGIADTVATALQRSGLAPHRLLLEITESVLLTDSDVVLDRLARVKALGTRIVMDDFGTGYSSLSYLWRFPFDKIKIDRSFMMALEGPGAPAEKIMRSIIGLGHSLGMTVCVEGVETARQAERVAVIGCDEVQGYYFGRPMPAVDLPAHILGHFRRALATPAPEADAEWSADSAAL